MAITNGERIGRAMELLAAGLKPFITRELRATNGQEPLERRLPGSQSDDTSQLLRIMAQEWSSVFSRTLGRTERGFVSELQDVRNDWAHNQPFTYGDTFRALDTAARLLQSVSAPQAEGVQAVANAMLRVQADEQRRTRTRTRSRTRADGDQPALDTAMVAQKGLKSWREVVTPHPDVQSGHFAQAQFAADFAQILSGTAEDAYGEPGEFFARTHLTQGIRDLLETALRRLSSGEGDPVVELQTNFGGGKTHSMIALYHLFGGTNAAKLPQIPEFLEEIDTRSLPTASRAVLVGTHLNPGEPWSKPDGTRIHTLWGEMAHQLGGREGYELVRANDQNGTSPGSNLLTELFQLHSPVLVLIDEWVAFVRQTHDKTDLPAGSFETNMTFAQALTEAASNAGDALVVASLPVSPRGAGGSPSYADEIEIGGTAGRRALDSLSDFFQRTARQWTPASMEESFEIVRRRLFEPLSGADAYADRDAVVRAFSDMYQRNPAEFPNRVSQASYQRMLELSYPVHPALFSLLYESWGTLERFQRTRGVLRLMAAIIHELWDRNDRGLMILPGFVPMEAESVVAELTRYLEGNWRPVIGVDIDGPQSLPVQVDGDNSNFGRYHAARRVARVVYLGSAPLEAGDSHTGIEDQEIKLGAVQPGESPGTFGDALRRLADRATHLNSDGTRYWYSTRPTITRDAQERADQLRREPERVHAEIRDRLRREQQPARRGEFTRVFPAPSGTADVDDVQEAGLVILGPGAPFEARNGDDEAHRNANEILANRGNSPRQFKNAVVFLAADRTRLDELEEGVRQYLAWSDIQTAYTEDRINLDNFQAGQVSRQLESADETVDQRIQETYTRVLVPSQSDLTGPMGWEEYRVSGQDALAVRVSNKLKSEERLLTIYAGTLLRMQLDRVLWSGDETNHLSVRQLGDYFAQHVYLPRLRDLGVLAEAVSDGMSRMMWTDEGFGYADGWDDQRGRYLGLHAGPSSRVEPAAVSGGLVVKPAAVQAQWAQEAKEGDGPTPYGGGPDGGDGGGGPIKETGPVAPKFTSFHGSKRVSADRLPIEAATIGDEVVKHLQGLIGADVEINIEIQANVPDGVPDDVIRTVTENVSTLKFDDGSGFEEGD